MKKILATIALSLMCSYASYANTIITAPLDSRPISTDYLANLAAVGGDNVEYADKENLDYFSAFEENNHIGDSEKVRRDIALKTSQHNTDGTTVIINTSSYITNGLVGSRCGVNYADTEKALNDLKALVYAYQNPVYYLNIQMPRTLPETRFNQIWPNNDSVNGLGWYYLQYNKDYEKSAEFAKSYATVTPSQLLLEYGYVANKATENGYDSLTKWEKEFYNSIRKNYESKSSYKKCIDNYKLPFEKVEEIFAFAIELQKEGKLGDIVVSNDDLQLPASVSYLFANGGNNGNWINTENGAAVKYSYARTAMQVGRTCIYNQIKDTYGNDERVDAVRGLSSKVNIIYGTDEIPQLIYARAIAQRYKITAGFDTVWNEIQKNVAAYDVKNPHVIMSTDMNFVTGGLSASYKTEKPFKMYVFDYSKNYNQTDFINKMNIDYKKGSNVGLVELFTSSTTNNAVFNTLIAAKPSESRIGFANLGAYSAWNTNGNAIGLGVAHAQVFAISQQRAQNTKQLAQAQAVMLGQHAYEDGIYTCNVKRQLANQGFKPQGDDLVNSSMLYGMLRTDEVNAAFKGMEYKYGGKTYTISNYDIAKCNFPWGRTFDCYIEIKADVK